MTPDEAMAAVGNQVSARYATGFGEHGRGRVVSYSIVPTFTIETDDGQRFSWRYDLCDVLCVCGAPIGSDECNLRAHLRGPEVAR